MSTQIKRIVLIIGLSLGITFFQSICLHAQQINYSGSMHYASGSYFFDENTGSFSLSNGFSISGQNLTVSFSLPFIIQSSPWLSYGATGYIPTGGPQHGSLTDSTGHRPGGGGKGQGGNKKTITTSMMRGDKTIVLPDTVSYAESSFGDPNIYANFKLYSSDSGNTNVQLNSGLKIPVADPANGFGTGEWDYGVGGSLSQRFGYYFIYLNLMKWWFGDMPDLKLQDPLSYSIGLSRSLAQNKWYLNTTFSGYTEIIKDYDPPLNIGFNIGYFVSERVSLNGSVILGLTESSADQSFGIGWTVKL